MSKVRWRVEEGIGDEWVVRKESYSYIFLLTNSERLARRVCRLLNREEQIKK